ncbi:MAG: hypothetical protein LBB05_03230 [Puniceicoccales bacterium]|nr:hypothetical protein [Puniceicoccales bacterium]
MNKLLIITSSLLAASNVFAEVSEAALNVDAKVEFNTAHVYEGRRRLDQNFAPNVEVGIPLLDDAGNLYTGVGATLGVSHEKSSGNNEVTPYVGFAYDIGDIFTFDCGYTFHSLDKRPVAGWSAVNGRSFFDRPFFVLNAEGNVNLGAQVTSLDSVVGLAQNVLDAAQKSGLKIENVDGLVSNMSETLKAASKVELSQIPYTLEGKKRSHEIYTGIMADVLLSPSLYFTYDFTQKKADINGAARYTFDLSSVGATGFAIDLGGEVGYTRVKKPYGINRNTQVAFLILNNNKAGLDIGNVFEKTSWFYTGANADLVYSLNENAKARAGVAFSYNNASKNSWINDKNHKKHNVWFSSAIEFSF